MVDHNRLKLATYNKAKEEGLAMKKFPIQAFLKLKTSTILTVNHGFFFFKKIIKILLFLSFRNHDKENEWRKLGKCFEKFDP